MTLKTRDAPRHRKRDTDEIIITAAAVNASRETRHRLIHGYYDVDPDIVWDTVQEDLPPLIAAIKKALS